MQQVPPAKRVLVIDDNPDLRNSLQALLESDGFEVAVAADGDEGLAIQAQFRAEVVVTDIFMPGKEGMETLFALREQFPRTSIIVMSGGSRSARSMDYLGVARELGAAKTLAKPFQSRELIDAVRELAASG
jgi:DNA-binding response OmpR family regulator